MNLQRAQREQNILQVLVVILILTALVHFTVGFRVNAKVDYGLGVKLLNERLFGTGSIKWNNIKLEAGGNYGQDVFGEFDRIDVFVQGNYLFSDERQEFRPYIGVIGRCKEFSAGMFSATFSGGGVVGGLSFNPTPYLNVEAGAGYINYSELTISDWDISIEDEKTFFELGMNIEF